MQSNLAPGGSWLKPRAMSDGEEVDWGPDDEVVLEGEWNPKALDLLKENPDFAKYKARGPSGSCTCSVGPRTS